MLSLAARRLSSPRPPKPFLFLLLSSFSPTKPSQNPPIPLPLSKPFSSSPKPKPPSLPVLHLLRGGCYPSPSDSPPPLPLCPGCGVHMQSSDPALPGFFSPPTPKPPDYHAPIDRRPLAADEPHISLSLKSGHLPSEDQNPQDPNPSPPKPLVCARCHSLRHYGRVKTPAAENLLPDFDFDRSVAPQMVSPSGPRSVVLMVVDSTDFDGSFPRKVARLISASADANSTAWKQGKPANIPRAVLVVTKVDLLPSSVSPELLDQWVRKRAHENGSLKLTAVHLVSAVKDWGVRNLMEDVRNLVGARGNVWAVGAQNAGKSTLINAMGRCVGGSVSSLTEAPVPGTTLGIVRVEGVLSGNARLFDTPGILHPYQISTRLTREEQRIVHIGKELRPRTYRLKTGQSIHIGGLLRVDVEEASVQSIYLTVWASPLLPLHMGKTEKASTMIEHFGQQLQPPVGEHRVSELGKWMRREISVTGNTWDANSVDIAAAGLGWVAVGLKGDAVLGVWTYDGVDVVLRSSLIPQRARIFEEAGFTVSKIVSQADRKSNKQKHEGREGKESEYGVKLSCISSLTPQAGVSA